VLRVRLDRRELLVRQVLKVQQARKDLQERRDLKALQVQQVLWQRLHQSNTTLEHKQ